ncbi:MAG TPA: DNA polymerase I [Dongiaceae bacterium]|nr:DNA polymerase I [Dongiaceae bacterium]
MNNPVTSKPKHVYLVDGSGYIFRAFHALPPLTRSDGTPTNAVLGFTNMIWKLLAETDADHIAVIFDAGRKTFRDRIYKEYKAHRPEPPDELIPQFGLIREATRAFGLPSIEMEGYEADDLIATYADQAVAEGADVTIVSSDKDLMQLIRDGIRMLDPIKNRPIGPAEVVEKFGVEPDKVIDVQALCGDSTDNVPGVPGIGVKTAAELIKTYGTLENLLDRLDQIKQPKRRESLTANAELARISKQLVTLKHDVPVEHGLADFARHEIDAGKLTAFLKANEFRTTLARVQQKLGEGGETAGAPAPAARTAKKPATDAPVVRVIKNQAPVGPAQPHSREGYQLVTEEAALVQVIAEATRARKVGFDTETDSPQVADAKLVGLSLSTGPGHGVYVPVGHTGAEGDLLGGGSAAPEQIPLPRALELLKPLLEDPSVLKVGHSIKFDVSIMAKHGIRLAPIDDTMLISYVLEGALHAHNMDELATLHLGIQTIRYSDVTGTGKAQVTFDKVPLDKARDYAAEDADVALRLHAALKPRLVTERLLTIYETMERPLIPVVADMELAGIKVDLKTLQRLSHDFAGRCGELEREIHKLAGTEFNIGSPKQLGDILFEKLKLGDGGKKGKTGAYSTGADVLEELAVASGHPLPRKVLDWRQLSKLKSTYTDALQEQISPTTGRVHTSYALAATSTGRLSSNDPNLQNIPIRTEEGRKIRHAFIAEQGNKLISVDYSQIELRLAAEMADIPALKQAFQDNLDIHALTASQVFGIPVEGMDPMVRRRAKAINFGIIYGISPFGLAAQLGIPQAEAKSYIEAYFARFPGIRDYMERTKKVAREQGYVTTLFGRRCHVPGINDKNPARRSFMERAAINAPLQGTAADIIKRAMVRMPEAFAAKKLSARMLLQVHDELVFEAPAAQAEETAAVARQVMEGATLPAQKLSVPLIAEAGIADNWAEAH